MLEVRDLLVSYGEIRAVKGISLNVAAGEIVALLGSNGAGKTTTLKTVSGLLAPRSGEILFDGESLRGMPPHLIVRKGIAHVPEGRHVFNRLTVYENLEMGAYARSDAGAAADLDRVFALFPRLWERRRQRAGTLSGGEQQMLAIGRALMARPRLILFDEPSLGLAPTVVETTFAIIADIRRAGTTVLMVEQNARLALRMADRGYVMESGRIVLSGAARHLLADDHVRAAYLGG